MKKTLTTLAALALVGTCAAWADAPSSEEIYNYSVTIDFVAQGTSSVAKTAVLNETGHLFQGDVTGSVANSGGSTATLDSTAYTQSMLIHNTNIGTNASNKEKFTITFTAYDNFTLDTLDFVIFTAASGGNSRPQESTGSGNPQVKMTATLSLLTPGDTLTKTQVGSSGSKSIEAGQIIKNNSGKAAGWNKTTSWGTITQGTGGNGTIAFNSDNLPYLEAGQTYTLELEATRADGPTGFFVGLGAVRMNGTVPEPTTATLSLLALAGLAARRRRK